eukprot:15304318-Ditylum_brightwellii.AAC.1
MDKRRNHPHYQGDWFSILKHHLMNEWSGKLGFNRAVAGCAGIALVLIAINITFIVGLKCISVALSNAIYQLQ